MTVMAKRLVPEKLDIPPRISEGNEGQGGENDHDQNDFVLQKSQTRIYSPTWQAVKKNAQRRFISTVDRIVSLSRKDSWAAVPKPLLVDPTELPVVQVGPVIGKVTENSARILLEISEQGKVAMALENVGTTHHKNTPHSRVEKMLEAGRPGIFIFENLDPATRYRVKLTGCQISANRISSFRTFPAERSPTVNFAVISCNKIFITEKEIPSHSDLWAHLAKSIEQRKIDMCLHIGDQVRITPPSLFLLKSSAM